MPILADGSPTPAQAGSSAGPRPPLRRAFSSATYNTQVCGEPTGVVVTVTCNAAREAQQIVVNHRPRSSLLLFSRLMGEKFAGTPVAGHFITSKSCQGADRPEL